MSVSFSSINLSQLPKPAVVEVLDFEAVFSDMLADLVARYPAYSELLESDPGTKILEVCAYRELVVRQRVNDASTAVMLAYAMKTDLDHLGALMNVKRLQISPADISKGIDAVMESDVDYRKRIQLAPQGFSVAGPEGAYRFHALSADGRVLDATATSPTPGHVIVTVLARDGDGTAPQDLLDIVAARLNADDIRPLTDFVKVKSANIVRYQVRAKLFTFPGPDPIVVVAAANKRIAQYVVDVHRLGHVPTKSGIFAALHVAGVERVELSAPAMDMVISRLQAPYCDALAIEHGGVYG